MRDSLREPAAAFHDRATWGTASSRPTSPWPRASRGHLVVAAERLALVENADEHRHHPRVTLGDKRRDDRLALLPRGARSTVCTARAAAGSSMFASARTATRSTRGSPPRSSG